MDTKNQPRERDTKRYAYTLDRLCRCGHSLGHHTASRSAGQQPCLIGDFEDATCDCDCFKPAKK